jgi:toluene monooxygenase system ferredoxin subunit
MPKEELAKIAEICEETIYTNGTMIFHEGDQAEFLYILLEGKVVIRLQLTSRPESVTVAVITKTNQSFGWSSVVAPYHYTAGALCEADCTLLRIPGKELIQMLQNEPISGVVVMRRIAEVISNRLRNSRQVLLKSL